MGVAVNAAGAIVFAEQGSGRVHVADNGAVREIASGLDQPMGVAVNGDTAYVAEAGKGRIVRLQQGSQPETVAEGLGRPEGITISNGSLYVVDTQTKSLIALDPASGAQRTIATHLPVGAPVGITPKYLGPIGDMAGPMINFCGLTAGPDGTLYLSGDAEGSVLALRPAT